MAPAQPSISLPERMPETHTSHRHDTILYHTRVPELHGITEEAERPGCRSNSAAHEICGPQQANDAL